jgi:dienelactone hydrolase
MSKYQEGENNKASSTNKPTAEETQKENQDIISSDIIKIATNYAMNLMEGDYEKAYSDYPHDAAMQAAVSAEKYKEMFDAIKAKNGDFQELGQAYSYEVSGYMAVDVPVKMSGENFNIEMYFDADNNIAGLKFVAYNEKTEEVKMPKSITEQELNVDVNDYLLGGTLTLPEGDGPFPLVILVHGSGPNDRDETLFTNKPFRDIAWGLAQRGIAVYRYDKRSLTYNEEFQTGYDLTIYDETIDDAVEISKLLMENENIDSDNVYILGHSLGGYALPRIAEGTENAAGYIMMAGSARAPHEMIPEQYEYLFNLDGEISDQEQATLDEVYAVVEKIENIDDYEETEIFMGMYKAYIKDLLSYDPIETAKAIEKPVLVLQGERDYQVTMTDYNMWLEAFGTSDNWTFNLYPKLNHLMMAGEGVPSNADYSVTSTVDNKVIDDIAEFMTK